MGLIADMAAVGAAIVAADKLGDTVAGAASTSGLPVGVDVVALADTIIKDIKDLKYKMTELDRVLPAGAAQTAMTTALGDL